jgi:hypothetical protein
MDVEGQTSCLYNNVYLTCAEIVNVTNGCQHQRSDDVTPGYVHHCPHSCNLNGCRRNVTFEEVGPSEEPDPAPEPGPESPAAASSLLSWPSSPPPSPPGANGTTTVDFSAPFERQGEPATLAILSDRYTALVVSLASLFLNSPQREMDVWLIGNLQRGEGPGGMTLKDRLRNALKPAEHQRLHVMDINDATTLLQKYGAEPLWTWAEAGSMGGSQDEDNQPEAIVKPEDWDYDDMHHDRFNMLRFYLPYLEPFRDISTLFFADDDITVMKDISVLEVPMGDGVVIAATCNGWLWDDDCLYNKRFFNKRSWYGSPVSYLGKDRRHNWKGCLDESLSVACQSDKYENVTVQLSRNILGFKVNYAEQPVWNFGLARFNMTEWRRSNMTEHFEAYMRANCMKHARKNPCHAHSARMLARGPSERHTRVCCSQMNSESGPRHLCRLAWASPTLLSPRGCAAGTTSSVIHSLWTG